jgi:cephalosporin hydroxylase
MDTSCWPDVATEAVYTYGALQHPVELGVLLGILHARLPEQIIEIGTWAGGLTWALAQLPTARKVLTVDRAVQPGTMTGDKWAGLPITWIQGDSTHKGTVDGVRARLDGGPADVLVIDGGHDYPTARDDWVNYTPLVADDGVVVVHDTQGYPGRPDVAVPRLWARIRAAHRTLELVAQYGGPGGTGIVWRT